MRLDTLLAVVIVTAFVFPEVSCITNQEFFDLVKDYAEDLRSFDLDDDSTDYITDDDGVIYLPGNADDELDVDYLLSQLYLSGLMQSLEGMSWKDAEQGKPNALRLRGHCGCHRYHCRCCLTHTFRVNLIFKKWTFRLRLCVYVGYRGMADFYFGISFNGRRVFHREISLTHPPALCFPIPKTLKFVLGCIQVYNIDLRRKSMCLRVKAVINLRLFKIRIPFKIGCFRIPLMDKIAGKDARKLLESMEATVENKETGHIKELSLADLPVLFRELQNEAAQKYMEQENGSWETQDLF